MTVEIDRSIKLRVPNFRVYAAFGKRTPFGHDPLMELFVAGGCAIFSSLFRHLPNYHT